MNYPKNIQKATLRMSQKVMLQKDKKEIFESIYEGETFQ